MGQEDFSGIATATALIGTLPGSSGAGTVVTLQNATGWPTGATGIPFAGTFGRGSATEEKILFSSRSGNNLTIAQRGYDDTVAITHPNGEPVAHTVDATVLRTSSAHIFDTTRDDHTQYARTDMSRVLTGSVKATSADHFFGANANGGAGSRLVIGSAGDPNNAYVRAQGSGADAGLVLRPQGAGHTVIQTGAANAGLEVDDLGNVRLGSSVTFPTTPVGFALGNIGVAVSATPVNGGWLFCSAGALQYKGSSGTVTQLAPA